MAILGPTPKSRHSLMEEGSFGGKGTLQREKESSREGRNCSKVLMSKK